VVHLEQGGRGRLAFVPGNAGLRFRGLRAHGPSPALVPRRPRDFQREVPSLRDKDRKSTRLNSSHLVISYAVFCLKKKKHTASTPIVHICSHCMTPSSRGRESGLTTSRT